MFNSRLCSILLAIAFVGTATGCPPREKKEEHKPGDGHDHPEPSGSAEEQKPGDGKGKSKDDEK